MEPTQEATEESDDLKRYYHLINNFFKRNQNSYLVSWVNCRILQKINIIQLWQTINLMKLTLKNS
jgi:hypothetical protein